MKYFPVVVADNKSYDEELLINCESMTIIKSTIIADNSYPKLKNLYYADGSLKTLINIYDSRFSMSKITHDIDPDEIIKINELTAIGISIRLVKDPLIEKILKYPIYSLSPVLLFMLIAIIFPSYLITYIVIMFFYTIITVCYAYAPLRESLLKKYIGFEIDSE